MLQSPQSIRRLEIVEHVMTEKSLGLKVSELIWEHDPKVPQCDPEACAKAAAALAGVLGALVATLTVREPERHDRIVALLVGVIEENAKAIRDNAMAQLREAGHV
jgi:hypothetical protein